MDNPSQAISHAQEGQQPYEEDAIFVGRTREIDALANALQKITAPEPSGNIWLVTGESGVGKTRLLRELRKQALESGCSVLQGQADAVGAPPYGAWVNVLRWLALEGSLSDQELSVFDRLVPGLTAALQRSVPVLPSIDPRSAKSRLFNAVKAVFSRQETPLVILLDDLHWNPESITMLDNLSAVVKTRPILIVGSYHVDSGLGSTQHLPLFNQIDLQNLDRLTVSQWIRALVGDSDMSELFVSRFFEATDGNPLRVVTALRLLGEQVADLRFLSSMGLPRDFSVRGTNEVVTRKVAALSAESLRLLKLMAVSGRALDQNVLQSLAPQVDLAGWRDEVADVLTIRAEGWTLAHEQHRQAVLDRLTAEEVTQLHEEVAVALERLSDSSALAVDALVFYWTQANNDEKERDYALLAGKRAIQASAYQRAIAYLERALALAPHDDPLTRRALFARLYEAYRGVGDLPTSLEYGHKYIETHGIKAVRLHQSTLLPLVYQVLRQIKHRFWGVHVREVDAEAILNVGRIELDNALEYSNYLNEIPLALLNSLNALNRLEMSGKLSIPLVRSYITMAAAFASQGMGRIASYYERLASEALDQLSGDENARDLASCMLVYTFYLTFQGDWERAEAYALRGQSLAESMGDDRQLREISANLSLLYYLRGQLEQGLESACIVVEASERENDTQGMSWGYAGQSQMYLRLGQIDDALTTMYRREGILSDVMRETTSPVAAYLTLGNYYAHNMVHARHYLQQSVAELQTIIKLPTPHDFYAIFNSLEACVSLWYEMPSQAQEYHKAARKLLDYATAYSRLYPVGKPFLLAYKGMIHYLTKSQEMAMETWHEAILTAQSLGTPYAEAITWLYMSRVTSPSSDSKTYLERAIALFNQIDMGWYAAQFVKTAR